MLKGAISIITGILRDFERKHLSLIAAGLAVGRTLFGGWHTAADCCTTHARRALCRASLIQSRAARAIDLDANLAERTLGAGGDVHLRSD